MLSRKNLITALADTIATDFFLDMLNPRRREPNFRFSAFNIEDWVRRGIGINLPSPPNAKELGQASLAARKKWSQLIAQVGDGLPENCR